MKREREREREREKARVNLHNLPDQPPTGGAISL